jgi:hypothetical protein
MTVPQVVIETLRDAHADVLRESVRRSLRS